MKYVTRLHRVCERALFSADSTLDINRTIEALTRLATAVLDHRGDSCKLWMVGADSNAAVDSLLIGAYYHAADYHGGQSCPVYVLLCQIGQIYTPGYSERDDLDEAERMVVDALEALALAG